MRELNYIESNSVNGGWGIPSSITAHLPSTESILALTAAAKETLSGYAGTLPSLPESVGSRLPSIVAAHPYAAGAIALGAAYFAYKKFS